jgi:hypothetical protein
MTTKEQIIEWLVANEAQTLEIIEKTNERMTPCPSVFTDIAKDQYLDSVSSQIINEITRSCGIPSEEIHELFEEAGIEVYLKHVMKGNG